MERRAWGREEGPAFGTRLCAHKYAQEVFTLRPRLTGLRSDWPVSNPSALRVLPARAHVSVSVQLFAALFQKRWLLQTQQVCVCQSTLGAFYGCCYVLFFFKEPLQKLVT